MGATQPAATVFGSLPHKVNLNNFQDYLRDFKAEYYSETMKVHVMSRANLGFLRGNNFSKIEKISQNFWAIFRKLVKKT